MFWLSSRKSENRYCKIKYNIEQGTMPPSNLLDMCLHNTLAYPSRKRAYPNQNVCSVQRWILFSELFKIQLAGWAIFFLKKKIQKFEKPIPLESIAWFTDNFNCSPLHSHTVLCLLLMITYADGFIEDITSPKPSPVFLLIQVALYILPS